MPFSLLVNHLYLTFLTKSVKVRFSIKFYADVLALARSVKKIVLHIRACSWFVTQMQYTEITARNNRATRSSLAGSECMKE